jgi:WD40 repeat protein
VTLWDHSWYRPDVGVQIPARISELVYLWAWKANRILTQIATPTPRAGGTSIENLAVSADGKRIAICTGGGMRDDPRVDPRIISIWDGTLSKALGWFQTTAWGGGMVFSPDGRRLVSSASDGTVRVWDALRFELRLTLFGERKMFAGSKSAEFVAFTPDGRIVATQENGRTIWDVRPRLDR